MTRIKPEGLIGKIFGYSQNRDTDKVLEMYASRAKILDELQEGLTREFCNPCKRTPEPCCNSNYYVVGIPKGMERLQSEEANSNATRLGIDSQSDKKCDYYSEKGCLLKKYKSPLCLGMLCEEIIKPGLIQRHGSELALPFFYRMNAFADQSLKKNPQYLFQLMDQAINLGERLTRQR